MRIISDGSAHFLYDYNAKAGDVWNCYTPESQFLDSNIIVHVDSVAKILVRGDSLRVIFTSVTDTPFINGGFVMGTVIEHVGTTYYFIPGPWTLADNGIPWLSCYQDSIMGAVISFEPTIDLTDSCGCHIWYDVPTVNNSGSVNFNSQTNSFNIAGLTTEPVTLNIYNAMGQLLIASQVQNGSVPNPTSASGLYFYQLCTGSQKITSGKFVTLN